MYRALFIFPVWQAQDYSRRGFRSHEIHPYSVNFAQPAGNSAGYYSPVVTRFNSKSGKPSPVRSHHPESTLLSGRARPDDGVYLVLTRILADGHDRAAAPFDSGVQLA